MHQWGEQLPEWGADRHYRPDAGHRYHRGEDHQNAGRHYRPDAERQSGEPPGADHQSVHHPAGADHPGAERHYRPDAGPPDADHPDRAEGERHQDGAYPVKKRRGCYPGGHHHAAQEQPA